MQVRFFPKFAGASTPDRKEDQAMTYQVRRPPARSGQVDFWDAVQKLSLFLGLLLTIRSLSE